MTLQALQALIEKASWLPSTYNAITNGFLSTTQCMPKPFFCEWALGRQKWPDGTIVCRRCSVSWKKNPATRSDKVTFLLIAIRGGDFLLHVREKKNLICCFLQELRYSFKVCKKYFSYAEFFVWEHEGRTYEHKWIIKFHSRHILVSIFLKKILRDWKIKVVCLQCC